MNVFLDSSYTGDVHVVIGRGTRQLDAELCIDNCTIPSRIQRKKLLLPASLAR